jgi:predicted RND superfamily exporter protein
VLDDFLPGSRAEQDAKLVILGDIRHTIDRNLPLVDDARRARLRALRPPDDLRVIAATELPRSLRRFYTENDGALGRIVTYVPRDDLRIWDGRVQLRLASVVRDLRLADGTQVRSSGSAVLFASMLDAIIHDGPRVSLASFIGVLLLVIVVDARRGAPYIMIPVLVGVLWMAGAIAALHVRLNFLNFIALPITFGISVDYAANVYLRYRQPGNSLEQVVAAAGSAVALCSLTTIIGYGALLVADTAALRTFGMAAILGELACVVAAVVLLPAFLTRHARRSETGHGLVET